MAQHDYSIANQSGSAFRSDLNNALSAIVSQNSGTSSPSTTFAYQMWADTTNNVMKLRNAANDAWIELFQLDGEWSTIAFENGTAAAPSIYFKDSGTDTGFYSPGANQVGISTGGTSALVVDASQRVGVGTSSPASNFHVAGGSAPVVAQIGSTAGGETGASIYHGTGTKYNWRIGAQQTSDNAFEFARSTSVGGTTFDSPYLLINSSGNVGIGTTSPGFSNGDGLEIQRDGTACLRLDDNTNSKAGEIYADSTGLNIDARGASAVINFDIGGSTKATLDNSGRLLVGTSSAPTTGVYAQYAPLTVRGYVGGTTGNGIVNISNGSAAASISSGGDIGTLVFSESSGGEYARVSCFSDGAGGVGDYPGKLVFSTTADGASSPTERMRITSNGSIRAVMESYASGPGTTNYGWELAQNGSNPFINHATNGTATQTLYACINDNGVVGTIQVSGSSTLFNTSSDYRLKENVVPLTGAADRLNQLQVRRFNFIADPDKTVDGFLAHEAQAVVPECVTGAKDEVDDEGNPVYQGIDQSKLVPLLTAALQEALAKIETLEARLTAAGI